MRRAAEAAGTVVEPVRLFFRERDQFRHRFRGHRRMHHQELRRAHQQRHRREISRNIVRHLLHDAGRHGVLRSAQQPCVAIGRRLRDEIGAYRCVSASAIIDYHLLAEEFGQSRREQARNRVRAAARRHRHDETHRAGRVILRERGHGDEYNEQKTDSHGGFFLIR